MSLLETVPIPGTETIEQISIYRIYDRGVFAGYIADIASTMPTFLKLSAIDKIKSPYWRDIGRALDDTSLKKVSSLDEISEENHNIKPFGGLTLIKPDFTLKEFFTRPRYAVLQEFSFKIRDSWRVTKVIDLKEYS